MSEGGGEERAGELPPHVHSFARRPSPKGVDLLRFSALSGTLSRSDIKADLNKALAGRGMEEEERTRAGGLSATGPSFRSRLRARAHVETTDERADEAADVNGPRGMSHFINAKSVRTW